MWYGRDKVNKIGIWRIQIEYSLGIKEITVVYGECSLKNT